MNATRPIGWLFNLFARKPQGAAYTLLESVQPVVEAGLDWPLDIQTETKIIAFGAGQNDVIIGGSVPIGPFNLPNPLRHRVYLGASWQSDTVPTGVLGFFTAWVTTPTAVSIGYPIRQEWYIATGYDETLAIHYILGRQGMNTGRSNTGTVHSSGSLGNVYVGPQGGLFMRWTQQPVSNMTVSVMYVERDANTPMGSLL